MPGAPGENGGREFDDEFLALFDGSSDSPSGDSASRPAVVGKDDGMAKRDVLLKQALGYMCSHADMDSSDIEYFVEFFMSLYALDENEGRFRHKYSDVCDVMYSHFSDDAQPCDGMPGAIVHLEDNIERIFEEFKQSHSESEEFSRFFKLKDHISLESIRARKQMSWNSSFFTRMGELSDELSKAQDELSKAQDELSESVEKSKRDYVAILGIFAAVVLAFNGAVSFSTSAIGSTAGHHPFSVGFVVLLVGFVLFNTVVALFTFLRMMVRESAPWEKRHACVFLGIDIVLVAVLIVMFFAIRDAYWL